MPVLIVAITVLAGILFWVLRAHGTVKQIREVDRDTKGLQRRAKSAIQGLIGTPLERVNDVRLAAVILMIQIVRTGSPVTASEKTRILELMENPLQVEAISATFERAWRYTEGRRPFSLVADPLVPLFRERLTEDERLHFVEMLTQVASAHSAPSELQREALVRLKRRLTGAAPALKTSRAGNFG
ncbi:hypothetical protein ASG52_08620 [Methylobacterium sp. Leaf456]|uniref:tellurite resistance TerB family protein n=1 Tax=Methylobacterium sp. Leaf456 TaxID=1736382 RepID=UPI0007015190|nr:TerB family tellurite resistance protein [Methylobacterium sp. Leaf456]KQT50114.1 hypothetical protein ASG52_08620 [Methylobacterium sp. Leaf456]